MLARMSFIIDCLRAITRLGIKEAPRLAFPLLLVLLPELVLLSGRVLFPEPD